MEVVRRVAVVSQKERKRIDAIRVERRARFTLSSRCGYSSFTVIESGPCPRLTQAAYIHRECKQREVVKEVPTSRTTSPLAGPKALIISCLAPRSLPRTGVTVYGKNGRSQRLIGIR